MHDGPFDRIIVWGAFESMPRQFVDLLSSNGVMVAPIGPLDGRQVIARLSKIGSRFERQDMMPVRFLPLLEGRCRRALKWQRFTSLVNFLQILFAF